MTKVSEKERAEALERLHECVKVGDKVYCILRHVSASGVSRVIQFVVFVDGDPRCLGYNIAQALGMSYDRKKEGVKVQGCGMDMGFHVVYELGHKMFPEGFGVVANGGGRPTSPRSAEKMIAEGFKFRGRNGDPSGWDNDGGYALQTVWL